VASEDEAEVGLEAEATEENALVRYTSASASRPDSLRTRGTSIPQEIQRSFTLLARYYTSPNTPSPTPITTSLLAFLDNFISNTNTHNFSLAAHSLSDIEDRLLIDTIRWARSEGIPFLALRQSIQAPSVHPVHQAHGLSIQPVYQAQRLSIQGPSMQPVYQAQRLSTGTVRATCSLAGVRPLRPER